jgi:hypothetical protein
LFDAYQARLDGTDQRLAAMLAQLACHDGEPTAHQKPTGRI